MLSGSVKFLRRLPPHCSPPLIIELDLLGPVAQPIERNCTAPEIEIPFIFPIEKQMSSEAVKRWWFCRWCFCNFSFLNSHEMLHYSQSLSKILQ